MIFLLAVVLPPLALALRGKLFQALLCLVLMITVIGWVPAAAWAVFVIMNDNADRRHREAMRFPPRAP